MSAPFALPAGVAEARALVDGLDHVLLRGLSRLAPDAIAALEATAAALDGTPLGPALTEAVRALARGELLAHHVGALALARAAIEGAVFDALFAELARVAGLEPAPSALEADAPIEAKTRVLLESTRQWLVELALAGLGQLDATTIAPALGSLRALGEHPPLRRFAALVDGLAHELLEHAPTAAIEAPPRRRWVDLWATAMAATFAEPQVPTRARVSGTLWPLGADVQHHDHIFALVVHALLVDAAGARRVVRVTLSAWRVDAIAGPELYTLVAPLAPELVAALAAPATLSIEGHTLLGTGDLLWDGAVRATTPTADAPFAAPLAGATITAPAPRDRHVLQLALPVSSTTTPPALAPIALGRVSPLVELTAADVERAKLGFVGLLRWDDAPSIQPLALAGKKGLLGPATGILAADKLKEPAAAVLRERASRLLRGS
jgi:hypothetical protein